jgi:hypothetical protein
MKVPKQTVDNVKVRGSLLFATPKVKIYIYQDIYFLEVIGIKGLKQYFNSDDAIAEALKLG